MGITTNTGLQEVSCSKTAREVNFQHRVNCYLNKFINLADK